MSRRDLAHVLTALADLSGGRAARLDDGTWALTPAGIDWIAQDRELSDR